MGDQTARGPMFPTTCARCGGRLSEPVSFCPHCGAHARFAFGDSAPAKKPDVARASATASAAGARADLPLGELLWPSRPTPLFESAETDPYRDMRPPSSGGARHSDARPPSSGGARHSDARPPSRGGARHWGVKTGTALALLTIVVLYGATVLSHRHDDSGEREQQATSSTVQGSVTTNGTGQANQANHQAPTTSPGPTIVQGSKTTTQGSITAQSPTTAQSSTMAAAAPPATVASSAAPATPALSPAPAQTVQPIAPAVTDRMPDHENGSVPSVAMSEPAPPPAEATQPSQPSSSRSQNVKGSSPGSTASTKGYGDKNRRLISLALARAHNGFEQNDLRMARSGVYWALSLQPDNREALMLKRELLSRERAAHDRH